MKAPYPQVLTTVSVNVLEFVQTHRDHGGADVVPEVAGSQYVGL